MPQLLAAARAADPLEQLTDLLPGESALSDGRITRAHHTDWTGAAQSLSPADLRALIELITLAEEGLPTWGGGSVSPTIWLFRAYERLVPAADDLADWVLGHTTNDYAPFGSSNLGAGSLAEYKARRTAAAERKRARAAAETARQDAAAHARSDRATRNLWGAIRRNDPSAVEALVTQGADRTATNDAGETPLEYAERLGHSGVVAALAE